MMSLLRVFIVVLAFMSLPSLAQDSDAGREQVMEQLSNITTTDKQDNDYFHDILAYMWGGFIFDETSEDEPSTLSHVVGFVNVLALLLGIVIVGYVGMGSVINSASTGEVLGKNWSTYWLPLRTAMSFGLIIPSSAGGYTLSTAQILVIKLVIMSSTAATTLWSYGVDQAFGSNISPEELTVNSYPYKSAYDMASQASCSLAQLYTGNTRSPIITITRDDGESDFELADFVIFDGAQEARQKRMNKNAFKGRLTLSDIADSNDKLIQEISFAGGACGKMSFDNSVFADKDDVYVAEDSSATDKMKSIVKAKYELKVLQQTALLQYFVDIVNYGSSIQFASEKRIRVAEDVYDTYYSGLDILGDGEPEQAFASFLFWDTDEETGGSFKDALSIIANESKKNSKGQSLPISTTLIHEYNHANVNNNSTPSFFNATEKYISTYIGNIDATYDSLESQVSDSDSNSYKNKLKEGGWIMAGTSFFRISDYLSITSDAYKASMSTSPASPQIMCEDDDESECDQVLLTEASLSFVGLNFSTLYADFSNFKKLYGSFYGSISEDDVDERNDLRNRFSAASNAASSNARAIISDNDPTGLMGKEFDRYDSGILSIFSFMGNYMSAGNSTSVFGGSDGRGFANGGTTLDTIDPFKDAVELGHGMISLRVSMMAGSMILNSVKNTTWFAQQAASSNITNVVLGTGLATSFFSGALVGTIETIIPYLYTAIGLVTALAWTLAYYIPMMPAILWITLVSAYCFIVIEAVIAAPLAVIMAATPEGEGIAGSRMEAAIKMLAAVILRPSLMVIGLFASIYLAKISYFVFIMIFWPQANDYLGAGLFSSIAIVVIFVTVLHQIVARSISVMDSMPSGILEWIGGGGSREFGQKAVDGIGGNMDKGSESMNGAMSKVSDATRRRREEARKDEKQSDLINSLKGKK